MRCHRKSPAHLIFVTSRDHLYPDITHWAAWAADEGILHHLNREDIWPLIWKTTEPNYANSKLLVMYAIEKLCAQALDFMGEPQVIINSICPGLVHTDIGRSIASTSWFMRAGVPLYLMVLGKSTDHGARCCVHASLKAKEDHGKFSIAWLSDAQYERKAVPNMTSAAGKRTRELMWKEIITELKAKVPSLQQLHPDSWHSMVAVERRAWWKLVFGLDISVLEMLAMGTLEALGKRAAEELASKYGA